MTELRWGAIRPPGWVWDFGERLGLGGELCSEREGPGVISVLNRRSS